LSKRFKLLTAALAVLSIMIAITTTTVFAAPPWAIDSDNTAYCGQQNCNGASGGICQANCQGSCQGNCDGTCDGNCQQSGNCQQGNGACGQGYRNAGCLSNQGCSRPCTGRR